MQYNHIPEYILNKGKEIWDAYEHQSKIESNSDMLRKYIEKELMKISESVGTRIVSVGEINYNKEPYSIWVNDSVNATHILSINFLYYDSTPPISGTMPIINICFSHTFESEYQPYLTGETDLRNGKPRFRFRRVENPNLTTTWEEPNTWGVRSKGRLIWCNESINSIDQAGWCFSLPLAAVQSTEDADELIMEPLKILMQGIDPEHTFIPFSPYTLQYKVNENHWELAE